MSQYLLVSTSVTAPNKENIALITLLEFVEKKYKSQHSNIRIGQLSDLKAGIEWTNKKCKRYHKTAIKRVVFSNDKTTYFGMDYRRWKFHKQKTVRLLSRLLYLLTECDAPKDLWNKFDCLYRQWHEIYGLAPLGSEIAALPYKSEFVDIIHDRGRTVTDKKAAKNIQDAFSRYDIFYKE